MDRITLLSVVMMSFPEAVLVGALGLTLVGVRLRWPQLAFVSVLQAGIIHLVRLSPVPFGLHTLLLTAIFIVLLRLIMRLDWRPATLAGLFGPTVNLAIETLTIPLLLYLTGYSSDYVQQDLSLRFLFSLPGALLLGILTWACLHFNFRLLGPPPGEAVDNDDWHALNRSYFLVYLLAVLPVMLLGTLNMAFSNTDVFSDQYLPVFRAVMGLVVLVLTALLPLKIQAIGRTVAEASIAKKNAESLAHIENLLQLVYRQHHDSHHQLQTVYGLLETGCYEEAREYIRKTHEAISGPLELIRTDQPHVTALLYTKLALAEAKQIRLEPSIECSLQKLSLSQLETSALLGNLLNNALDAVESAPPAERVVRLEIRREPGGYVITVANRGRLEASQQTRLFQPGYTTKEGHAGMGLTSVRETVAKYDGILEVFNDGKETVFRVLLPFGDKPGGHQKNVNQVSQIPC